MATHAHLGISDGEICENKGNNQNGKTQQSVKTYSEFLVKYWNCFLNLLKLLVNPRE